MNENMVMIDLETMGNKAGAPVLSIGAVAFNLTDGIFREHAARVTLESCMSAGLKPDASTILWWMKQGEEARAAIAADKGGLPLPDALKNLADWYRGINGPTSPAEPSVWGNGAGFDQPILGAAYDACGMDRPWPYHAERCYRTMKALFPEVVAGPFEGARHVALNDARHQAKHLLRILHRLPANARGLIATPVQLIPWEGAAE